MSEQKMLVYQLSLPVRWADMDVNAHVNHTRYFTYFEAARLAWLEAVCACNPRNAQGPVVAQASCNYRRSIPYPETLRVQVYAGAPARSSFTTYYDLFSERDASIKYADGLVVMVWVDRAARKSLPLPDYLRKVLVPNNQVFAQE